MDETATTVHDLDDWRGPYGGLPPFDRATPDGIEAVVRAAIERKRSEIAAIASNPAAPTFANTVEALEDAGRALRRADALRAAFATTHALDAMPAVQQRLAPLVESFEDEIAHDETLFARVETVHRAPPPERDAARLTSVVHRRFVRRGAGLARATREELAAVNARIAAAQSQFQQNLIDEAAGEAVVVTDEAQLAGLPDDAWRAAADVARARGHAGAWAIANTRPAVWPVLQYATDRALRRRVRDMWTWRGGHGGPFDNRALAAEIVTLRGRKARLLGAPTFAHWATADRMAGMPDAALELLLRTWAPVRAAALAEVRDLHDLAAADGIDGPLEPWDFLFYRERARRGRFGIDAAALMPYLALDNVLAAVFDAARRLHGLTIRTLDGIPAVDPGVRAIEVSRDGAPIGVVWLDLLRRDGKMRGSWQAELRAAERFRTPAIALSTVCSNLERRADGTVLMGWEYANVLFHEFGHALHMLMSRARYPSLGSMATAWDAIELPSQLNERWLRDPELLRRFARHHHTGEPIPERLLTALAASWADDRAVSVSVDYLVPAIVDLRMHLAADGTPVDPVAIEAAVSRELDVPPAIDPVMRVPHQFHSFTDAYAAGLYAYLWADVMVADVVDAFEAAPDGIYDAAVAERWRDAILCAGNTVPAADAFRNFRGRDPDPSALLRRYALA